MLSVQAIARQHQMHPVCKVHRDGQAEHQRAVRAPLLPLQLQHVQPCEEASNSAVDHTCSHWHDEQQQVDKDAEKYWPDVVAVLDAMLRAHGHMPRRIQEQPVRILSNKR